MWREVCGRVKNNEEEKEFPSFWLVKILLQPITRGYSDLDSDTSSEWTAITVLVSQTSGAFRSTKTSALNFRQLPDVSGKAFSKISTKEDNLARYTQIFKNFSREFAFHSTLLPGFLEFSVEWFASRKFNSFRNFWKLFGDISVPFTAVSKFSKVLDEWKAPIISRGNHWWRREKSAVSQGSHPQLFIHNDIEQRYGVYFAMKS